METRLGLMQPQAKDCLEPLGAGRGRQEPSASLQHLVFRIVASRSVRELISVVLSHHVYRNALRQPPKAGMLPCPQSVQSLILDPRTSEIRSSK